MNPYKRPKKASPICPCPHVTRLAVRPGPCRAILAGLFLGFSIASAGVVFTEQFEGPVVVGFDDNTAPNNGQWIGSSQGFGATDRGLYNEDVVWPASPLFSTPFGEQAYYLNYSNSALTTAQGVTGQTLTAGVTYKVSFNTAVTTGTTGATYLVELVAFSASDTNTLRNEGRSNRPGTVLATASGSVSTSDMSQVGQVTFTPAAGNVHLGKEVGIRLVKANGSVLYDNVRLVVGHDMAPSPASGITRLGGDVPLGWTNHPANTATDVWVDVWFGTDPQALAKVVDKGLNTATTTVNVPTAGTYYWRVDSYLDGAPTGTPLTGDLFHFVVDDTDGDGFTDAYELANTNPPSNTGLNPGDDLDGDGLTNLDEFNYSTDPNLADTDGDTLGDGAELAGAGLRPATSPLSTDTDGDGLSDLVESNNGIWAGAANTGTNPADTDWDNDGLSDGAETKTGILVDRFNTGTDPYLADTDSDGAWDWYEVAATFTNPNSAGSASPIPYPLPDPDGSTGNPSAPVKVYVMAGQSNTVGIGYVTGTAPGSLETIAKRENKFPNIVDPSNNWNKRNDVIYKGVVSATAAGPLTAGQGASSTQLGPELGFGHVMGWYHDEPVLILKASQGNRSLGWDFLPPGSGSFDSSDAYTYAGYGQTPTKWLTSGGSPATAGSWYAGKQYDECFRAEGAMGMPWWASGISYANGVLVKHNGAAYTSKSAHTADPASEPGVGASWSTYWAAYTITNTADILNFTNGTLQNLPTTGNNLNGRSFEIAGFCWWQGHKDHTDSVYAPRYEQNLVNLIDALRAEFNAPTAPVVVASIGFGGGDVRTKPDLYQLVHGAQLDVGNPTLHPEFGGTVKSVDTLPYWRELNESPGVQDFHYNNNAETYMLVGDAMGRAMIALEQSTGGLVGTFPADDAAGADSGSDLILTFGENQVAGSGNLTLRNLTDGIDTVIPVSDPRVTIANNQIFVETSDLVLWERDYAVRLDAGFVQTPGGAPCAAIADDTTWNFATGPDELTITVQSLRDYINGVTTLNAQQIADAKNYFVLNRDKFDRSAETIADLFDLVETFDAVNGPLWISTGSFNRDTQPDDLNWTMYHVMQYIMDEIYTPENLALYESTLVGFKFGSSARFPGACAPPSNPNNTHSIDVYASYPDTAGWDRQGDEDPARRATGAYVAPGTIVTVTVPPALVGAGYQIRVGAHSWDMEERGRSTIWRLDRASLLYPINSTTVKVASPYGGGIYIEVPKNAAAGVVNVSFTGAVRSPLFSMTSYHTTTVQEWQDTERNNPAPWTDFRTDNFMCQIPTAWIYNVEDPTPAMQDWKLALDTYNDLMGFPRERGKESMYLQVDVINRSSVFAPGYPAVNYSSNNPTLDNAGGNKNVYLVNGPRTIPNWEFHEQGHGYRFPKFTGEQESTVNLPHAAIMNQCFGKDMDWAHADSLGFAGNPNRTMNNTAIAWMCSFAFSPREVEMASSEKAYQLKGQAKFVDIARMFGWDKLNAFWKTYVDQYELTGVSPSPNDDTMTIDLSKAVGKDMRPLLHFWGIFPNDPAAVDAAITAANLPPSAEVYELLTYYKSIVPANNAAFRTFALGWWGHIPDPLAEWTESEHGRQWDSTDWATPYGKTLQRPNGEIYAETGAADIQARVQVIIDLYFPGGNPDPGFSSPPSPDPMSFATAPYGVDPQTIAMTATPATDIQGPVQYCFENVSTGQSSGWSTDQSWTQTGLALGTSYDFRVKARDAVGNETAFSAIASAATLPDNSGPSLVSINPPDGTINVAVGSNLTMNFGEDVLPGSGQIRIRNLSDYTETAVSVTDASQVSFSNGTVTINPIANLAAGKGFAIVVDAGAITDVWGNPFGGILDNLAWNFSTAATPQETVYLTENFESPDVSAANSTGNTSGAVPSNGKWVGATIGFGATRRGIIDKSAGGFSAPDPNFQAFAFRYSNSGLTSAAGAIGTLQADLNYEVIFDVVRDDGGGAGLPYTVQLVAFNAGDNRADCSGSRPGTVLKTVTGNAPSDGSFATVTLQFTATAGNASLGKDLGVRFLGATASANIDNVVVRTVTGGGGDVVPPAIALLNPANGAPAVAANANLVVTFDEAVAAGSGNITLRNLTDATDTVIAVTDATQVGVNGAVLTINPSSDLVHSKSYAVRIAPGAILDTSGNAFAGIASDAVWVFTTAEPPDTTPPVLAASGIVDDRSGSPVVENNPVTYTVAFSEDMDESTVDASDFGNAGSATVTIGAPAETSPGVFTVVATPTNPGTLRLCINAGAVLTDAAGNALGTSAAIADDTVITVEMANVAPAWSESPVFGQDAAEDAFYASTLADDANDANGDTLSFAKINGPAWLDVAADGGLSGTPAQADIGANSFTVSVTDGIAPPVETTLNITVLNTNDAPAFASDPIAGTDAAEDAAYSGTLAGSAADADGDALTYAKVSGPAWLALAADGTLSGTPTQADVGANDFTVSVTDGIAPPVEAALHITVANVNDAPVFVLDPFTRGNATATQPYGDTIAGSASDGDADSLAYAKVSGPGWLNVAGDGTLSGTPSAGDVGANSFIVSVSDGTAAPVEATLEIMVDAQPPVEVFADNFEPGANPYGGTTPSAGTYNVADTSKKANTTLWVRASSGFKATSNGLVGESENGGANFADPTGTQAYGFRYTNSGLTTAEGVIGALAEGTTLTVSFDVVKDGFNGGLAYDALLVLFDPGASRSAVEFAEKNTAAVLARKTGDVSADGNYHTVTFSYTVGDGVVDNNGANSGVSAGYLPSLAGKDIALRFDGATNSANIDNVRITLAAAGTGGMQAAMVPEVVVFSQPVPEDDIITQDTAGGDATAEGTPVDLVVSLGPPTTTVPDLVGRDQASAEADVLAANLVVGAVSGQYSATIPAGEVISQGLGAGCVVPQRSAVDLSVSLGYDSSPKLVRTTVHAVSNTRWTSVDLGKTYKSAVIVATPVYPMAGLPPVVTRLRNVTGSGFDLKVERVDGLGDPVSFDVSVIAVDEGVYTQAEHGVTMEAVKFNSTVTARKGAWAAEARAFQNAYKAPVVVGQVMSANDPRWSVFWSMGSTQADPVDASNLNVGKHVGEDPVTARADETIGYIVIESGSGTVSGVAYEAALGDDIVRGFGNSPVPFTYSLGGGLPSAGSAAASVSGMDGGDGAWAVLSGSPAVTSKGIGLHACEDQLGDSEQSHPTTQVGYIVFE